MNFKFTREYFVTDFNELGIKAMQLQKWDEAIVAFQHVLKENPKSSGTWYMLGQCHRFSDEIDGSIQALKNAISLNDKEAPFFLALGIAYQLAEKYEDSLDALTEAARIDPDYSLAYNSAAITRRKMGDHKRALEIYDLSIQAHLRKFLRNYQNTETQEPYGFINLGGELTTKYILTAAIEHAAMSDIDKVLLPTELDVPKSYAGLLWIDEADGIVFTLEKGSRYYTANFFDTLKVFLGSSVDYWNTLANKSRIFQDLGDLDECNNHLNESQLFREFYERNFAGHRNK